MTSQGDDFGRSRAAYGLAAAFLMLAGCSSSDTTAGNGAGAVGAGGAGQGGAGQGGASSGADPKLPAAPASCPTLATGNITVRNQQVQIWAGTKGATPAPILFYWHGTGTSSTEASIFMSNQIKEITDEGGVVASFTTTTKEGTTTNNNVWYTGDFGMTDDILMCAIQQFNIDTHRIYSAGCSAGGLQSGAMVFLRSSYLAAAMTNSGGTLTTTADDPTHVPSLITAHGSCADYVALHFADWSIQEDRTVSKRGGFAVDCNHGGGHCGAPQDLVAAQWQFLKDHPFGVTADPYANGLPSSFPTYCRAFPIPEDDGGLPCPTP